MYVCARHPCPVLSGPEESVRFPGLDLQMVVSYCEHTENQAWDLWKNSDLQLKHLVLMPLCKVISWTYKICLKCFCLTCNKSILNIIKTNLLISPFYVHAKPSLPFLKCDIHTDSSNKNCITIDSPFIFSVHFQWVKNSYPKYIFKSLESLHMIYTTITIDS